MLEAAATKWNFQPNKPGLVGGHCIGVDPYYLSHVAKKNKYNPNFLISGREINNNMTKYISKLILKACRQKKLEKKNINLLVLGLTFKENVSDLRNSKILNLIEILQSNLKKISIYDPEISAEDLENKFKKILLNKEPSKLEKYNLIIYAVAHKKLNNLVNKIYRFKSDKNIIVDLTLKLKNEFIDIGF